MVARSLGLRQPGNPRRGNATCSGRRYLAVVLLILCSASQAAEPAAVGEQESKRLEKTVLRDLENYRGRPIRKFVGANARDPIIRGYVNRCLQKISGNLAAPDAGVDMNDAAMLTFAVQSDGVIESIEIDRSSDSGLAETLIDAITASAPFLPFPNAMKQEIDVLHITKSFGEETKLPEDAQSTAQAVDDEAAIGIAERHVASGDLAEAIEILDSASHAGNPKTQVALAEAYVQSGDLRKAEIWLRKAAEAGDAEGQFRLAGIYSQMLPNNQDKSVEWLRKAAAQGHRRARLVLDPAKAAPAPPEAANGVIATVAMVAYVSELSKHYLTADERALACYKLDRLSFDSIYNKSAEACGELMMSNFPDGVPRNQAIAFSRQFGTCIKDQNLKARGVAREDLVRCVKKL